MKTIRSITPPADDYDIEAWDAFYAENPNYRRSLSAAAADASEGDVEQSTETDAQTEQAQQPEETSEQQERSGPTDAEAKLLKEVMKYKGDKKALEARLQAFEGVDVERYNRLVQAESDAEAARLRSEGDFDKLREQIVAQHNEAMAATQAEIGAIRDENAALRRQIDDLTIGGAFSNSDTVRETVYTPNKARALFGAHFERSAEGAIIAFDKPAGADDRTVLVDGQGKPLAFDAALKRIIDSDVDAAKNWRPSLKPGGDSKESTELPSGKGADATGDKILAGIGDLMKSLGDMPL